MGASGPPLPPLPCSVGGSQMNHEDYVFFPGAITLDGFPHLTSCPCGVINPSPASKPVFPTLGSFHSAWLVLRTLFRIEFDSTSPSLYLHPSRCMLT